MTREEAINKIRQMSLPKETMDILEALAPELTMSEDEMMIYELQGFLSSFGSDYFGTGEWQKFDDWLEKQKEQKPVENSTRTKIISRAANEKQVVLLSESNGNAEINWDTRSLEDAKKLLEHGIVFINERLGTKSAEWSDEDADMLNCCISSIEEAKENRYAYKETDGDTSYDREIDWLKSLRPSWKPSEQEKGALRTAIYVLREERNFPKAAGHLQAILDAFEGKESRKDWKPSEEQMRYLLAVINDPNNIGAESCYLTIKSLYNDLEKLIAKR